MTATIIIGPPCAGKTTYVNEKRGEADPVVDMDALAQAMGAPTPHQTPEAWKTAVVMARFSAIKALIEIADEVDSYIIHSRPSDDLIKEWQENENCELILLDPGEKECRRRRKKDGRPEESEEWITKWYEEKDRIYAALGKTPDEESATEDEEPKAARQTLGTIEVKSIEAKEDGGPVGTFTAYASVFGNVDSYGDMVLPGAFKESLEEIKASGKPLPLYYAHNTADPDYCIGQVLEAKEDEHGLWVRAALDLQAEGTKARRVYDLMKRGLLNQMSFMYRTVKTAWVETEDEYYREIREAKIFEVSVVHLGANEATEVLSVKSSTPAEELAEEPEEAKAMAKAQPVDNQEIKQRALAALAASLLKH